MLHHQSNEEKENTIAPLVRSLLRRQQYKMILPQLSSYQSECDFISTLYRYVTKYFIMPSKAFQLQILQKKILKTDLRKEASSRGEKFT